MEVGSRVRLIGVPKDLEESLEFPTRSTLERCVGQIFTISGFNSIGMAGIDTDKITGIFGETIFVEAEFLQEILDEQTT